MLSTKGTALVRRSILFIYQILLILQCWRFLINVLYVFSDFFFFVQSNDIILAVTIFHFVQKISARLFFLLHVFFFRIFKLRDVVSKRNIWETMNEKENNVDEGTEVKGINNHLDSLRYILSISHLFFRGRHRCTIWHRTQFSLLVVEKL